MWFGYGEIGNRTKENRDKTNHIKINGLGTY